LTNGVCLPRLDASIPEEDAMRRLVLAAALCLPLAAAAQVTTLKVVSAFPENSFYVTRLNTWI
jgi:hypothetical protein